MWKKLPRKAGRSGGTEGEGAGLREKEGVLRGMEGDKGKRVERTKGEELLFFFTSLVKVLDFQVKHIYCLYTN